jgi:uncharacterized membrane protein
MFFLKCVFGYVFFYYLCTRIKAIIKNDMSTLTIFIVLVFCIGYLCIALEGVTKINKAAIALLMCVCCWTLLMMGPGAYYPEVAGDSVIHHIAEVI